MKNSRIRSNVLLETCATSDRTTGLERVGETLYTRISDLISCERFGSVSSSQLVGTQYIRTPKWLFAHRSGVAVPITFPPSIVATTLFADRVIPYIHDLFLVNGKAKLTKKARVYMKPAFERALSACSTFATNSETTRDQLSAYCNSDSDIFLLRPAVEDVFSLKDLSPLSWYRGEALRLVAIGTVEPRKGYIRLARFRKMLETVIGCDVNLDIIGRKGWGPDWDILSSDNQVTLHGYASENKTREIVSRSHALISSSYDEGLGLPLLEIQHGSRLVIASNIPAHREVLAGSGILIDFENIENDARDVARYFIDRDLHEPGLAAVRNVDRWNRTADDDLRRFIAMLSKRISNDG